MDLYLLSFNNYYNRQVKKFDTFAEYEPYILDVVENYNFVPGDGVNTVLKAINYSGETQPDYVLVVEGTTIKSRWFVIDSDFIRQGQYQISLHRDMVADSYDAVLTAPCFIEKATVSNDDVAIFNSENIDFNQIKTSETPLKDETNTPWIVGYIPSDAYPDGQTVNSSFVSMSEANIKVSDITQWKYYKYCNLNPNAFDFYMGNADIKYAFYFHHSFYGSQGTYVANCAQIVVDKNGNLSDAPLSGEYLVFKEGNRVMRFKDAQDPSVNSLQLTFNDPTHNNLKGASTFYTMKKGEGGSFPARYNGYIATFETKINKSNITACKNILAQTKGIYSDTDPYGAELRSLNGQTIQDEKTGSVYRINVQTSAQTYNIPVYGGIQTNVLAAFPHFRHDVYGDGKYIFNTNSAQLDPRYQKIIINGTSYTVVLEQQQINIKTDVLAKNKRSHLVDAPYDMFCMPYFDGFEITENGKKYKNNKFAALNMAIGVGASTGSGNVYDVQILPYCPIRNAITSTGFDISSIPHNSITSADGGTIYTFMIWCDKSDFTFDINYKIDVKDYKISNECDMYRLCSPNYASVFEFSAAQNKGVDKFNVDCTYKPFNPYIHINPNFKGLFGRDFNDARGLILGGDFSITQLSSAWADYELTNKNFQASFDRSVQNMKVNNKYQREAEQINAITGIAQGIAAGGMMGSLGRGASLGGIAGGLIGGLAGGAVSAWGAKKDLEIQDALRAEALDYTKDQFGYQLGNIKAIPYTLTKTSALTANNKLFPVIEYYTCSDEEKEALRNKIRYNGMTVMRIGTIAEFLKDNETYIKGKLIRLNDIAEDFHYINSLSAEIDKGIFIER